MNKLEDQENFGEIRSVKAEAVHSMEHMLTEAARGLLCHDPTLYSSIHYVQFPIETTITVTYDDWLQTWSCFNVKDGDVKECVDQWHKIPVEKNNNYTWDKTVNGYNFKLCSYEYRNEVSKNPNEDKGTKEMVATVKSPATAGNVQVKPSDVKVGDLMSFTYWAKVDIVTRDPIKGEHSLNLTDLDSGETFGVRGDTLIEGARSADQHEKTMIVTKTQIVDVLANARNIPFTVSFKKQNGSIRHLRGRLIGIDQKNLGYIDVEDLDQPVGSRFRLVDCRTIRSVTVRGCKFTVK